MGDSGEFSHGRRISIRKYNCTAEMHAFRGCKQQQGTELTFSLI